VTGGGAATTRDLLLPGGRIGQLAVVTAVGGVELRHRDDEQVRIADLQTFEIERAFEVAKFDDRGVYRALKTAPNLRHGWRIECATEADVRRVIDQIYPARIAAAELREREVLATTPLRATLNRQSGMYKSAARITDAQLDDLVAAFCRSDSGCLRTIFWRRDDAGSIPTTKLPATKFEPHYDQTGRGERNVPLICQEACNLLVGAAREVVRGAAAI